MASFQSIAATKKWRHFIEPSPSPRRPLQFPINSRHQEVATRASATDALSGTAKFPINSRHQEVATYRRRPAPLADVADSFQSIAATKKWRRSTTGQHVPALARFPINSRHQEVATMIMMAYFSWGQISSFQSIAATKKWRLTDS